MPSQRGESVKQPDVCSRPRKVVRFGSISCFLDAVKSEVKLLSCVWLFATPQTVAYKAPLSMEFSRQEYWSGLPFPSPEDLPKPGIEPGSPALQADALPSKPPGKPWWRRAPPWWRRQVSN